MLGSAYSPRASAAAQWARTASTRRSRRRPRDPLALGAIAEPDDLADPLAERPALVAG